MKKVIPILVILFLTFACNKSQNQFTLTGHIDGKTEGTISLNQYENGQFNELFSAAIVDGSFDINGMIASPELYFIKLSDIEGYSPVFLEASKIKINIALDSSNNMKAEVKGSASNALLEKFNDQMEGFDKEDKKIYEIYYQPGKADDNQEYLDIADSLWENNEKAKLEQIVQFVKDNNDNAVVGYIAYRNSYMFGLAELENIVAGFNPSIDSSKYTIQLKERIAVLQNVDIGKPFVNFTMNDTLDKPIQFSDYVGKGYLLVDFWASWCTPCRAENPNVVAIFNDYHEKGFDVFGVSLDKKKENWLKAIKDDNLTWTHVSDLIGWQNAAAKLYGVRSIPHSVLLDPKGIIIAKNLRGEELRNKIAELLD
jgi:peroxiredoxin